MDSEILGLIVKELNKNGVNLIKHDFSNIDTFSPENVDYFRPGELPQIFDFSEHDKVFEDKIDLLKRNLDLQKDKRCEVEIERNYLAERINQLKSEITSLESHMSRLRERCMDGARRNFDRGNYGCLTILNRNGDLETESEKLKQHIAELESKETLDLPFDPLECANYLINATYERETNSLERGLKGLPEKVNSDRYTVDELEQIAEHLLIYCRHNKNFENDGE